MRERTDIPDSMVLVFLTATSVAACLFGRHVMNLRYAALRPALRWALEWMGLTVVFIAANTIIGIIAVVTLRVLKAPFVSLYGITDTTVAVLSCLQAAAFQSWLKSRDHPQPRKTGS